MIVAASSKDPTILAVFLFGGGLFGFFWGLRAYSRKRLMQNTPTSTVASVALGPAELQGRAIPHGTPMTSPIMQAPCVYWRYTVEEYRKGKKSGRWVTIARDERRVPFFVEDDTGKILVDSMGAEIDIPQDLREQTGMFGGLSANAQVFCNRQGYGTGFFSRDKRFTEWHIAPDDTLYVFGAVVAPEGQMAGVTKVEDRLVRSDRSCSFFYIADKSAKEVESAYAWKAAGGIFGGGLVVLVGLGILLNKFGIL